MPLEQPKELAWAGLRAFVISGKFGLADAVASYGPPAAEVEFHVAESLQR